MALPSHHSIAAETWGPCRCEGKSLAAVLHPGGVGQQGSGLGEQVDAPHSWPCPCSEDRKVTAGL